MPCPQRSSFAVLSLCCLVLAACGGEPRAAGAIDGDTLDRIADLRWPVLTPYFQEASRREGLLAALEGEGLSGRRRLAAQLAVVAAGGALPAAQVAEVRGVVGDGERAWRERMLAVLVLRHVDGEADAALRTFARWAGGAYPTYRFAKSVGGLPVPPLPAEVVRFRYTVPGRLWAEPVEPALVGLLADEEAMVRKGALALLMGYPLPGEADVDDLQAARGVDWRAGPADEAARAAWEEQAAYLARQRAGIRRPRRAAITGEAYEDPIDRWTREKMGLLAAFYAAETREEKIRTGEALQQHLEYRSKHAWVDYPGHYRPAPSQEERELKMYKKAYRLKWGLERKRLRKVDYKSLDEEEKKTHLDRIGDAAIKHQKAFATPIDELPALAEEGAAYIAALRTRIEELLAKGAEITRPERYLLKQHSLVVHVIDRSFEPEYQKDYHPYVQMMHIFATTRFMDFGGEKLAELEAVQRKIDEQLNEAGAPEEDGPATMVDYFRWEGWDGWPKWKREAARKAREAEEAAAAGEAEDEADERPFDLDERTGVTVPSERE